jgi:succinate dehydrogenase flavin-adding protein (antitoxin of CptAB toxin-antitoxin module)
MPIVVTPESNIPLPFDTTPEEVEQFRDRAKAAVETIKELISMGAEVEIDEADRATARSSLSTEKIKVTESNAGALLHLDAILSEYDRDLLNSAVRLRSYVTNKLLIETTDEDPKVRLKALELLGKTAGVGLFSERLEVNVTHRTIDQIDNELDQMLEKYMGPIEIVEPETTKELDSLLALDDDDLGDIVIDPEDLELDDAES